ncbi:MAG: TGS domain-containing protein [Candidatus Pacearchaeota archaeon]|nr:TGS domain-containing protein [Candidatus Pacearchaeota archaeon]
MPINASPEYFKAQGEYLAARTKEEKIKALEKMIKLAPKHKGSEKLLAELRSKLAKLKREVEEEKKRKKHRTSLTTIKKTADALVVLVGLTNSGRSSLLASLTNATPKISPFPYTTNKPEQGVFDYGGCKIQVVELPALRLDAEIDAENLSIIRISDLATIVATNDEEINKIQEELQKANISVPLLIVHNKSDTIPKVPSKSELSVSALTKQNISELKDKIFSKLKLIRIFTKEPGKPRSLQPIILKKGSTVKDLAEKIHKSFVEKFSHALVWGKSVKFQGQRCGFNHQLEDMDIVEIYLKK